MKFRNLPDCKLLPDCEKEHWVMEAKVFDADFIMGTVNNYGYIKLSYIQENIEIILFFKIFSSTTFVTMKDIIIYRGHSHIIEGEFDKIKSITPVQ